MNQVFVNDKEKQKRYELFCLALVMTFFSILFYDYQEEKIPTSIVISKKDSADVQQERKEFGKEYSTKSTHFFFCNEHDYYLGDHYRTFRSTHSSVDLLDCCSDEIKDYVTQVIQQVNYSPRLPINVYA